MKPLTQSLAFLVCVSLSSFSLANAPTDKAEENEASVPPSAAQSYSKQDYLCQYVNLIDFKFYNEKSITSDKRDQLLEKENILTPSHLDEVYTMCIYLELRSDALNRSIPDPSKKDTSFHIGVTYKF